MAAKFEFESRKDAAAARTVLQQAIKANPRLQHLWIEVNAHILRKYVYMYMRVYHYKVNVPCFFYNCNTKCLCFI